MESWQISDSCSTSNKYAKIAFFYMYAHAFSSIMGSIGAASTKNGSWYAKALALLPYSLLYLFATRRNTETPCDCWQNAKTALPENCALLELSRMNGKKRTSTAKVRAFCLLSFSPSALTKRRHFLVGEPFRSCPASSRKIFLIFQNYGDCKGYQR